MHRLRPAFAAQNCSSNIPINIEIKIKYIILCQQIKAFFEKIFKKTGNRRFQSIFS